MNVADYYWWARIIARGPDGEPVIGARELVSWAEVCRMRREWGEVDAERGPSIAKYQAEQRQARREARQNA